MHSVEKKTMEFALIAAIILLAIVVIFNPLPLLQKQQTLIGEKNLQKNVIFNVKEYSNEVSSKKAKTAILEFAEEESDEKNAVEVTVYNQNIGLVKEIRELDLKRGFNLVRFEDIAETIKPESVLFKDLDFKDTFVVEQNYEYDLANETALLKKYVGKDIVVQMKEGNAFEGKLISYTGNLLLETVEGIVSINAKEVQNIQYPKLAEGLLLKPSLIWTVYANSEGKRNTQISYLADGLNWKADYVAEVNDTGTLMDLKGWVTVQNNSGTSYPQAVLKLMAGEIHTVPTQHYYKQKAVMYDAIEEMTTSAAGGAFEEQTEFEYHLYTLQGTTTLKDKESKQISLLTAKGISVEKEFVFDNQYDTEEGKVKVKINFTNSEENGLGMPLPAGTVRIYSKDSEGSLQFVGEDSIKHTGKDVERKLFLGNAFDLSAKKEKTSYETVGKDCYKQGYKVTLKNSKDNEDVIITVVHKIWGDTKLITSNYAASKQTANEIEFKVPVKANSETELTFITMTCW